MQLFEKMGILTSYYLSVFICGYASSLGQAVRVIQHPSCTKLRYLNRTIFSIYPFTQEQVRSVYG